MRGRKMELSRNDLAAVMPDSEIVELAKRLVSIPSYTTEESDLASFITDYLNDNGIEAELQEVPLSHLPRTTVQKSHNVIGRVQGIGGGRSLLINGHMDHGPLEGRSGDDLSRWT